MGVAVSEQWNNAINVSSKIDKKKKNRSSRKGVKAKQNFTSLYFVIFFGEQFWWTFLSHTN